MIMIVLIAIFIAISYGVLGFLILGLLLILLLKDLYNKINNLNEEELKCNLDNKVKKINSAFEKFWKKILKK